MRFGVERVYGGTGVFQWSVSTEIGPVAVGSRLWIKWVDPSCPTAFGQWYGADVTGLTKTEVAVRYPENAGWEAWDETLPVSDVIASRVSFTPPAAAAGTASDAPPPKKKSKNSKNAGGAAPKEDLGSYRCVKKAAVSKAGGCYRYPEISPNYKIGRNPRASKCDLFFVPPLYW